jgi:transposase
MNITTVGADLAKDVITVCRQDRAGKTVERRDLRRGAFLAWLERLPKGCVVAMEACSSSHFWAREAVRLGLEPRIIAAEFVQPFRKSRCGKNDRNDAEAIAIAAREANMRFVAVKSTEQQGRLAVHRLREGWKEERTALMNRIRGVLAEFGVSFSLSSGALRKGLAEALHDEQLPAPVRELIACVREDLERLDHRIAGCDRAISLACRADPVAKRLQEVTGVGPTTADAMLAMAGNARAFRNGRQFAAWVGLTPRQFSSGGKSKLGGITRRGDAYLRTLLVQGARSCLQQALRCSPENANRLQQWIVSLHARAGYHKTLVAIANKNARMLWALMSRDEPFNPEAWKRSVPTPT